MNFAFVMIAVFINAAGQVTESWTVEGVSWAACNQMLKVDFHEYIAARPGTRGYAACVPMQTKGTL